MFELVVSGVILLAVGYWATMFAMGRRDDVLHGRFVQDEPEAEPVLSMPSLPPRARQRNPTGTRCRRFSPPSSGT